MTNWTSISLSLTNKQSLAVSESLEQENARLKAEVERLTERLNRHLEINDELDARCTRLRKHGDAMAEALEAAGFNNARDFWNAAKEGKPSEQKSPSFIEDLGNGVEKHDLLFRYPAKEGKPSV